jgi:hypothetical protein
MSVNRRVAAIYLILLAALVLTSPILLAESGPNPAPAPPAANPAPDPASPNIFGSPDHRDPSRPDSPCMPSHLDSPFIPVDSWVYPAVIRLYSLGFVDNVYLGMRPWTRSSVENMLETAGARIEDADDSPALDQAQEIYEALIHELESDTQGPCRAHQGNGRVESIYTVARGISGTPLRDSYHLGSTIVNDYGRPYSSGFSSYTGASGYAAAGRFQLYIRGESQATGSYSGYSPGLAAALANEDELPFINPLTGTPYNQATIPLGPIGSVFNGRLLEAYASARVLNHELSFGRQDSWLGPGLGAAMAYSNNAQNIYSFRINRAEPLWVPLLSRLTGPFRYDFMVGALRGHTYIPNPAYPGPGLPNPTNQENVLNPGDPWMHLEKISFRPTPNIEFGFERTVIWGGRGHVPITIHTFLRSFFSFSAPQPNVKCCSNDPGARFGAFDFSWRLPFVRRWLTLYSDSEVHDDVSPIDAPRRAAWHPGLYLSHFPGLPRLDLRVEGVNTDPPVRTSNGGGFMYFEAIQKQGYTNAGQIFGDWVGREGKGGQAWLTLHFSGNESFQVNYRNQKVAKDFVTGGTTLNDLGFQVVKRLNPEFELNGQFHIQHWTAPIYNTGVPTYPAPLNTVTNTTFQLTWFPKSRLTF